MDEYNFPTFKFALVDGLSDNFLPQKGEPNATGWDVCSTEDIVIDCFSYAKIPLGFRVFAPQGWWLELRPRSSSFAKKHLHALYGVIDENYQGQLIFACHYIPSDSINTNDKDPLIIKKGEALGQIIPVKRQEMIVEKVSNEEYDSLCLKRNGQRGAGGFGSTKA